MRKTALALGLSVLLLMTTGCQKEEADAGIKENQTETEQTQTVEQLATQKETEVAALSEEEAKKLVTSAMDTIRTTLRDFADQYDWGYDRSLQPDLNIIKEALLPIATETYIDTNTDFFNQFYQYLETCAVLFPYIDTDVRFVMEQQNDELHIETLELATELNDGGQWTFDFMYEDDAWKLDQWSASGDAQLTQEEASKIVNSSDEEETYVFVQEVNRDGAKQYEFKQKYDGSIAYVNAETTYVTYNYDMVIETEPETVEEEPEEVVEVDASSVDTDVLINNFKRSSNPPSTGLDTKNYYLNYLSEIDAYNEAIYNGDGGSYGEYPYALVGYELYDAVLNEIWDVLFNNLDAQTFETLKSEQLQWIDEKEVASKAEGEGAGFLWPLVWYYWTATDFTVDRCNELLNTYFY